MLSCPKCGRHYAQGLNHCPEDGTALRADETIMGYTAPCAPLIGQVLDEKYRLDEWLGEGGMGTVYRATHMLIDRPVAVKVLHARFVEDEAAQQRFRREARAAGRLQHPNAVAVTDFGRTSEGCVYIVMELLEGRTLREVMAQDAPLPVERVITLMSQIAAAVEAAHEGGVIHRDLKPANIFVVQRKGQLPVVKVLDFGIAKLAADSLDDSDAKNLTQTGVMIGTPRYMSPEQCDGEKLTPASDVYSLGIILYEMLTGETPFNGASPLAIALQHSSKSPRPPREIVPTIPSDLERVVLHALAKKPADRPSDAGAFREELNASERVAGLVAPDPVFAQRKSSTSVDANGNGDGERTGSDARTGSDDAKTPSGRLVVDLSPASALATRRDAARANVKSGDTTMLADSIARRNTVEQQRSTGAIPISSTAAGVVPPHARVFTRLQILMRGRGRSSRWLRRPAVLIALAIGFLVFSSIAAVIIHSRNVAGANAGGATTSAAPSPSTEAKPQPSPINTEASDSNSAKSGKDERGREEKRPTRAEVRSAKRPAKGNAVVRTLKKIFKNPF
ncbi:MAG: eukaryotic-like serine/threonine-protein kinase [Acidobacteriota bacterium]|nr:eukaryotic-like serine/threonine-protein kinase [Acidobacteriota bacterium]